ncbi:MAG: hypothetical protein ACRD1B_07980, partial [Thermoanaerobaculia bacterium]
MNHADHPFPVLARTAASPMAPFLLVSALPFMGSPRFEMVRGSEISHAWPDRPLKEIVTVHRFIDKPLDISLGIPTASDDTKAETTVTLAEFGQPLWRGSRLDGQKFHDLA